MNMLKYATFLATALVALAACTPKAPDTAADTAAIKAVPPVWFDLYNSGDADGVAALYAEDDRYITWTRAFGDAIKTFATGAGYVNYMTDDEGTARVRATYEINYDRLVAVKRKYDPTNFFSGNQNISPKT